jgi:hypothetical protein
MQMQRPDEHGRDLFGKGLFGLGSQIAATNLNPAIVALSWLGQELDGDLIAVRGAKLKRAQRRIDQPPCDAPFLGNRDSWQVKS